MADKVQGDPLRQEAGKSTTRVTRNSAPRRPSSGSFRDSGIAVMLTDHGAQDDLFRWRDVGGPDGGGIHAGPVLPDATHGALVRWRSLPKRQARSHVGEVDRTAPRRRP